MTDREFEEDAFRSMEVQICAQTRTVQITNTDNGGDHPTSPSVALDWDKARDLAQWILSETTGSSEKQAQS
jgi:hypothetical protein